MKVQFSPKDDIEGITIFTPQVLELEPDEMKNVDFVIRVTEPGWYEGTVDAIYSIESTDSSPNNATITVEVFVRAELGESNSPLMNLTSRIIAGLSNIYVILTLVGIGIILLITGLLLRRR